MDANVTDKVVDSVAEVNFDGLVGPTHNFSGLSQGNIASLGNAMSVSNPKAAALQGLSKMKLLVDMGYQQGVLPPHERPFIPALKRLGFTGNSDEQIWENAWHKAPNVAQACVSASPMWVANAATVSPSADSCDGRVHFSPANLSSMFHRAIEADTTSNILQSIFNAQQHFKHHSPLPACDAFSDEGAANHTRFCSDYTQPGVEFFVYGKHGFDNEKPTPKKFPARQTLAASQIIALRHQLNEKRVVYAQQNPAAIDAGVFHNDVISVGNKDLLFYHEEAFLDTTTVLDSLQSAIDGEMHFIEVPKALVSIKDSVDSYLFNTQLLQSTEKGKHIIIAPSECERLENVKEFLDSLVAKNQLISDVHYLDLRQSMKNGGGPACLRLRVVLTQEERASINARVFMDDALYDDLCKWVNKHYRDTLSIADLKDPALIDESRTALDELTNVLNLGSIYPFQLG